MGSPPGRANALLAGAGEARGGALLALALATPAAGAAGTMAVAASMHKDNGFFAQNGGLEYPAVLALTAGALALSGPGQLSLDAVLGHRANQHWMRAAGLAAVPVAVAAVVRRRKAALATIDSATPDAGSSSSELPRDITSDH